MSAVRQALPARDRRTLADKLEWARRYILRASTIPAAPRAALLQMVDSGEFDAEGQACVPMARWTSVTARSRRTMQRYLRELEIRCEIYVERRPGEGPRGKHAPSIYRLGRSWPADAPPVLELVTAGAPVHEPAEDGKLQNQQTVKVTDSGSRSFSDPGSSLEISIPPPIARAREAHGEERTAPNGATESRPPPSSADRHPPRPDADRDAFRKRSEEAVCMVRATSGDRRIRDKGLAGRAFGRLRTALAQCRLSPDLLLVAARQYCSAKSVWGAGGWRNLEHGVEAIIANLPAWAADVAKRAEGPPRKRGDVVRLDKRGGSPKKMDALEWSSKLLGKPPPVPLELPPQIPRPKLDARAPASSPLAPDGLPQWLRDFSAARTRPPKPPRKPDGEPK